MKLLLVNIQMMLVKSQRKSVIISKSKKEQAFSGIRPQSWL
ncbi:unnamed protein product [Paramecium octaurelia]|uniref:Uncharacterized protein n=1 Tax=Paramecium octaurelia TaxID=43137 RepID=A0A8S1SY21_PAROT|nr:unnamed protein product [Paramecium octaurelia]